VAVEIHYCPVWSGYDRRAASLAAFLNEQGVEAAIAEGAQSQFDVVADGRLVFSKQEQGRWPDEDEILALVRW